jgi:adenine deaminase
MLRLGPASATLAAAAAVAQGKRPADLVVSGGTLVNVFTEELLDGWGVAVAGDRIAYVGPDAETRAGPETTVIDAAGDLIAPGLIEGHTHLTRVGLTEMARLQVAAGVTTTVLEGMEFAYVCGARGLHELMDEAILAPGRFFVTVSAEISPDPVHHARLGPTEDWVALLDHPAAIGVGELYWADLLRGHERAQALVEAALARGMAVEGHGAGARVPVLNALAAAGVGSDHEGIDADDLLNRLRLGMHAFARHGATRQDLRASSPLWRELGVDLSRLGLVTDGLEPEGLARGDSLNWVVEQAMELGLPPARAIRVASRNVAEHFGLGRHLGGLGPGMLADICVVPRGGFRPRHVLVGGRRPPAGRMHRYPDAMLDTVHVDGFDPFLLEHPGRGRWRAIELVAPMVTREAETDGEGALVLTAIDRIEGGRGFRGLLLAYGLAGGAVAWSSGWESPCVVAAGDSPADMTVAVRRVADMRGGAAVSVGGRVMAEWRAPLGGLYSQEPLADVINQAAAVQGALRELGCPWPNPLLTLETMTTAAIPHLRIWAGGYARLRDGARLGLEL